LSTLSIISTFSKHYIFPDNNIEVFVTCIMDQVHPEGKFVVDIDKNIDINDVTANSRVALRSDSYTLHKILPNKVCDIVAADSSHSVAL